MAAVCSGTMYAWEGKLIHKSAFVAHLRWMVPVFRFFEFVNFERKEQQWPVAQVWGNQISLLLKVDSTSFQVFWLCKLWKEQTKSQLNVITKFVYDSIAKLVLVQKRQLFCHQLLPWQRYLMIVQTYFWPSNAYILKTNLVTPNFFHISFFVY